jgi:6-phosphogluconate dehydrogenase
MHFGVPRIHTQFTMFFCMTLKSELCAVSKVRVVCSEWVQNHSSCVFWRNNNNSLIYSLLDLQIWIQTVAILQGGVTQSLCEINNIYNNWKAIFKDKWSVLKRQELRYILRSTVTRCKAASESGAQNFRTCVLNKVTWTAGEIGTVKCQCRQLLYVMQFLCWDQR